MRRAKIVCGIACLIFGTIMIIESYRLGLGSLHAPGPGFWPFTTGILFAGFSFLYFVGVLKSENRSSLVFWSGTKWYKPFITMLTIFLFSAFLEKVGFILSTVILMAILFRVDQSHRWHIVVGGAIISSIATYSIFNFWLKVSLPWGPWGF